MKSFMMMVLEILIGQSGSDLNKYKMNMKKLILVIILCISSILGWGQLRKQVVEEFVSYKTVCKLNMGYGEIRYFKDEGFVYFGETDNRYEVGMASIYLGRNKKEAVATLKDLKDLDRNIGDKTYIVRGLCGKSTRIYKSKLNGLGFSTEDIAGISWAMSFTNWDKVIDAVNKFEKR